MSFALCYVLINCFMFFNYSFYVCVLFCTFCFVFCVFYIFVLFLHMYIVVYFLFVYNCTNHCQWVETQLQLINIISYIILTSECSLSLFSVTVISIHILLLHKWKLRGFTSGKWGQHNPELILSSETLHKAVLFQLDRCSKVVS